MALEETSFPDTWATGRFRHRVLVKNLSAHPLQIDEIYSDCACTLVRPTQLHLDEGGAEWLELEMDFLSTRGDARPHRRVSVQLVLVGPTGSKQTRIEGAVRDLFAGLSRTIVCPPCDWVSPSVEFELRSLYDLRTLEIQAAGWEPSVQSTDKREYSVTLRRDEPIEVHEIAIPVAARFELADDGSSGVVEFDVVAPIARDVVLAQTAVALTCHPGKVCQERVLIRSTSGQPFTARAASCDNERFSVRIDSEDSAGESQVVVQFKSPISGRFEANIQIEVEQAAGNYYLPLRVVAMCNERARGDG